MPLGFEAIDGLWIALSVFLVLVALGLTYVLIRLGGTIASTTSLVQGFEQEVLPVINETGGTVRRVNAQLDKADVATDSAVDIFDNVDTAVRAITIAITRPVQKISGLTAGVVHGIASLRVPKSPRAAFDTGRAAAHVREQEIANELRRGGAGSDG